MKHDYWKDNYNIDKFSDYVYLKIRWENQLIYNYLNILHV